MPIHFSEERWQAVKENATRWWAGELKRPLIQITLTGCDPGRERPELPPKRRAAMYDPSVPVEKIVDRWDYTLSTYRFLGDAFPSVWPDFGPGILAAVIGGRLEVDEATVWFFPPEEQEIDEIAFHYDEGNLWLTRIKDLCREATERWEGLVQIGMTDLGGTTDLLSTFRPGEKLLMDLYDHPEAVKRQIWTLHDLWWRGFSDIDAVLRPLNPGYTCWTPIFSSEPYYMLQSDMCYMIGPAMFNEFVRPELAATCRRLTNPFYHLDGPGQLRHLDALLSIPELKGIQWIPGAGAPGQTEWPEVYRKVRAAGKLIQIHDPLHTLDAIVAQLGSAEGIVAIGSAPASREAEVREFLRKYKVID
jgi:hypothetical protein